MFKKEEFYEMDGAIDDIAKYCNKKIKKYLATNDYITDILMEACKQIRNSPLDSKAVQLKLIATEALRKIKL